MKSYLCIGDIHGCIQQLRELMDQIHADLAQDPKQGQHIPDHIQWVFLGDYIDRGPDPAGVIEYLRKHAERYPESIFLRGNHEEMLFDVIESVGPARASEFLERKGISRENYDWLAENSRFCFKSEEYVFTHAGLNVERGLPEQTHADYLWSYHESEFYNAPDHIIVHGHISVDVVTILGNNVNVDTGCGKGGRLSAILLPEGRTFASETRGVNQKLIDLIKEAGGSGEMNL
ncbi:MAG: serine/threonine protein phosphatase [bacterium]|nr:serine/threonine protein phosphatase [bacterium]